MLAQVLPKPDLNRAPPMWVKVARPFLPHRKRRRLGLCWGGKLYCSVKCLPSRFLILRKQLIAA
jgi:hypothetical protein